MKIAILHDYFDEIGGAEIVLLYLARALNATIFTTNIDKEKIVSLGFGDIKIISIGKVMDGKHIKQFLTKIKFLKIKLKDYDFFIFGGSSSIYASYNNFPNAWMVFSIEKGLYNLRYSLKNKNNFLVQIAKKIMIYYDKKAVDKIQTIISPSKLYSTNAIKKYYGRESILIPHGVDTKDFYYKSPKKYWLAVERIDPIKNIEMKLMAFKNLKDKKLLIVGEPSKEHKNYLRTLKKIKPANVSFYGSVYDKKRLGKLYAECIGFITTSKADTSGLNVVEAMASGKPVIAPNEWGYKETIINGKTGILIDDIDKNKLADAVKKIEKKIKKNPLKFKTPCQEQAKKFDMQIFVERITEFISAVQSQQVG